jgi:outer membrane scaffolding protein for murein synthesis (MipA/OmpV family)
MRSIVLGAAVAALASASPAFAQEEAPGDWTIGLGVGMTTRYDGSDEYRIIPAGYLRGEIAGIRFSTRGLKLYVNLVPESEGGVQFEAGPVAGIRLDRTSGNLGNDQIEALGELDTAIEVGGHAGVSGNGILNPYDSLGFSLTYLKDVAGAHDSHVVSPSIDYRTPVSRQAFVGVSLSADYVGGGFADYYFSVTPAGALASGLPAYDADGGFRSWSLGLSGAHSLSGDIRRGAALFVLGSYSRLGGDIADSPIVESRGQWFGAAGLAYTF